MVLIKRQSDRHTGLHLLVGFNGLTPDEELKHLIKDFSVGGIVLFRRNIESGDQVRALLEDAQKLAKESLGRPLWVAIDQEGGPVQRLVVEPFTRLPSAREIASKGPQAVDEWASIAARELRGLGIQINLAPVLDTPPQGEESHFMAERSLGLEPERVAELGLLWIEALQRNGVSATAKHYPGLGLAESDPHHFAPVIRWKSEGAMQRDLLPFERAIRAGVHCVMTSHALYPFLDPHRPATLSPPVNRDLLRSKLGFDGPLLSDDLDMAAVSERYTWEEMAREGLESTIDFFLLCQRTENIEAFYRSLDNTIGRSTGFADLHRSSLARIQGLFKKHGISAGHPIPA